MKEQLKEGRRWVSSFLSEIVPALLPRELLGPGHVAREASVKQTLRLIDCNKRRKEKEGGKDNRRDQLTERQEFL